MSTESSRLARVEVYYVSGLVWSAGQPFDPVGLGCPPGRFVPGGECDLLLKVHS
jgi:hypothetical protein